MFSEDIEQFQAVANQVGVALENAQLYQRTKELSSRDELSGLFNRRYFFENLETEIQRARRYRRSFTILMLDLDQFKPYNDTHGHLSGDQVLRQVAELLLSNTRRADVVARFGGEEFVIMLPEIDRQGGALVAEKIRIKLAQYPFHGRERQPGGQLTVTIGLATYPFDSDNGARRPARHLGAPRLVEDRQRGAQPGDGRGDHRRRLLAHGLPPGVPRRAADVAPACTASCPRWCAGTAPG